MKGFQILLWFNYSATARGKRSSTKTKTKSRTPLPNIPKSYYCNKNKSFAFASSSQRLICQQPSSKQDIYNPPNQHIHYYHHILFRPLIVKKYDCLFGILNGKFPLRMGRTKPSVSCCVCNIFQKQDNANIEFQGSSTSTFAN